MDIKQVIERAGGAAHIAQVLGITRQAVHQWRKIPIDRVLTIERLSGVNRREIRPDKAFLWEDSTVPKGTSSCG